MKKKGGHVLFSASDLNAFIDCRHKTVLSLKDISERLQRAGDSDHDCLIKKKGSEHEATYLYKLKSSGLSVVEIPSGVDLKQGVRLTLEAMGEGPDYIYQAVLWNGQWHGYVDLLKRVETPSKFGSFSYEAVDTKLSKQPKPCHVIQLCVYSDLLEQCQNAPPLSFSVVLGSGEEKSFLFQDFAHYYAAIKRQFEAFVGSADPNSRPFPCTACSLCHWRNLCGEQWIREDHLGQVADIRRSQINKLEKAGIATLENLAHLGEDASIPQIAEPTLDTLKSQARLQLTKRETGKGEIEHLQIAEERGFSLLPKPDPNDLFFDMEGNPHHPGGLEYLFGIFYNIGDTSVFKPFWAHDEEQEKQAFQKVMDFICAHLAKYPDAHIYHYNHYETTALTHLAAKYASREENLDHLLRNKKFVDLYRIVKQAIRTSAPGYSIKDLEPFYMKKREGDVANAQESIVVYDQWCTTQDDALLKQISDYNEFDCRSTYLLQQWLLDLRPAEIEFYNGTETTSEKTQENRKEAGDKLIRYQEDLLSDVTEQDLQFRELIAHLLDFHRREKKPQQRAMFERQLKDLPELIEDAECLAGLTLDPSTPIFQDKQSMVHTYDFPPQEHKVREGKPCKLVSTLKGNGSVFSLDEKRRKIGIKSTIDLLPAYSAITIETWVDDRTLTEAIYRFADAIIENSSRYRALESFLKREVPTLSNGIPKEGSSLERAIQAVSSLQEGYLFIQGPPGTGKTYTASRVIVELIRFGKRIGVSSNSHKAIHNLLTAIEEAAEIKKISFRGQKKCSDSDSRFNGKMIQNITKDEEIDQSSDLLAGTAWIFSKKDQDQAFDYLFIDEAGQISLANLIAMGISAKNIVLMGDQMQLAQPTQGVHPGSSGQSTLEYLLQGASVISPDRGIFLEKTRRMHENICRFISDAVYEGRLHPEPINQNQALILSANADKRLLENGIQFIPATHNGCRQKSEEEGKIVQDLYLSLLNQQYRDQHGDVRNISFENILVIAPYNAQVNYLESILPEGAWVGTVDKLQGQEAEVILFSMTTSCAEDLPRDLEFLYSKNRLNVAISRARTLAVVIANPNLLQISCNSIDQMRLVNTFCRVHTYSLKMSSL